MNPTKLGHRAAAQGATDCPFSTDSPDRTAWFDAGSRVEGFREHGLDPNGHQPPPPHLCPRSSSKAVCNCCHTCTAECRAEETPKGVSIDRVLWAIVRIANAVEHHEFKSQASCPTCGSCAPAQILGNDTPRPVAVCSICGAPGDAY